MDENEINYEEWHQEQRRTIGLHLIEAVMVINHTVGLDSLREVLIERIVELDLPNEPCKRCGISMNFFMWGIQSRYCIDCIKELEDSKSDSKIKRRKKK